MFNTPWSLQKIQKLIPALRLLHRYHEKKILTFIFKLQSLCHGRPEMRDQVLLLLRSLRHGDV